MTTSLQQPCCTLLQLINTYPISERSWRARLVPDWGKPSKSRKASVLPINNAQLEYATQVRIACREPQQFPHSNFFTSIYLYGWKFSREEKKECLRQRGPKAGNKECNAQLSPHPRACFTTTTRRLGRRKLVSQVGLGSSAFAPRVIPPRELWSKTSITFSKFASSFTTIHASCLLFPGFNAVRTVCTSPPNCSTWACNSCFVVEGAIFHTKMVCLEAGVALFRNFPFACWDFLPRTANGGGFSSGPHGRASPVSFSILFFRSRKIRICSSFCRDSFSQ